jgi:hypothetical protein
MNKEPNPNCELCEGTGLISMDEAMNYAHFSTMECDCTKEN